MVVGNNHAVRGVPEQGLPVMIEIARAQRYLTASCPKAPAFVAHGSPVEALRLRDVIILFIKVYGVPTLAIQFKKL